MHRSILCFDDVVNSRSRTQFTLENYLFIEMYCIVGRASCIASSWLWTLCPELWNAWTSIAFAHDKKKQKSIFSRFCSFKNDRRLGKRLHMYDTFNCIMAMAMCAVVVMIMIHYNDTHRLLGTARTFSSCIQVKCNRTISFGWRSHSHSSSSSTSQTSVWASYSICLTRFSKQQIWCRAKEA